MNLKNIATIFSFLIIGGSQLVAQNTGKSKKNKTRKIEDSPVVVVDEIKAVSNPNATTVNANNTANDGKSSDVKQITSNKIVPYQRPYTVNKENRVGVYPKQRNNKQWDGRTPGIYSIRFKMKGLKPGETVYIADHHIGGKYLRDTAVVDKKGIANFTGNFWLQRGMYLFVLPEKKDYFEFLIDDDQHIINKIGHIIQNIYSYMMIE